MDYEIISLEEYNETIDGLTREIEKLNDRIDNAINFIDQVLMYHLQDYKQLDEDCNTLIGILKGNDKK